jgi:hypothetical protein
MPGKRTIVGVMRHKSFQGRVEIDEKLKRFFPICEHCGFTNDGVKTFDEAFKMLAEHRRTSPITHNTHTRKGTSNEIQ